MAMRASPLEQTDTSSRRTASRGTVPFSDAPKRVSEFPTRDPSTYFDIWEEIWGHDT
jgi:hypothetical protein